MEFLISICKGKAGLLHLNLDDKTVTPIVFEKIPESYNKISYGPLSLNDLVTKATGLSYFGGKPIAMVTSTLPPTLISINMQERAIDDAWVVECPDPHSIFSTYDSFYVVGTGSNRLYRFYLDHCIRGPYVENPAHPSSKNSEIYFFEDPSITDDRLHFNSAAIFQGDLYISAFGMKKGETWSTADEGYIKNVRTGEIVSRAYHPHSLTSREDSLYFCDSCQASVRNIDGEELSIPELGYTRGLAFNNNYMLVATSQGRKVSKSTGKINNPSDPGLLAGTCAIYVYAVTSSLSSYILLDKIDLTPWAAEVYDILPLSKPNNNLL